MAGRILFGEYLVQKGLLSSPTVLGLLIEQIKSQPSVAQVIFEHNLLTEPQQLETLRVQSRTGWDYQQACVDLKFWNEEIASTIVQKSVLSRPPLGQLIVSKGLMSFGDLTKVLDEFVGMCELDGDTATAKSKAPPSVAANPVEVTQGTSGKVEATQGISAKAASTSAANSFSDGFEPKLQTIDRTLLDEFFESVPETLPSYVATVSSTWAQKMHDGETDLVVDDMLKYTRDMESMQAAARFVRAELLERISIQALTSLRAVLSNEEWLIPNLAQVTAAINHTYEVITTMRSILREERSEKSIWTSPEYRNAFFEINNTWIKLFEMSTN